MYALMRRTGYVCRRGVTPVCRCTCTLRAAFSRTWTRRTLFVDEETMKKVRGPVPTQHARTACPRCLCRAGEANTVFNRKPLKNCPFAGVLFGVHFPRRKRSVWSHESILEVTCKGDISSNDAHHPRHMSHTMTHELNDNDIDHSYSQLPVTKALTCP